MPIGEPIMAAIHIDIGGIFAKLSALGMHSILLSIGYVDLSAGKVTG